MIPEQHAHLLKGEYGDLTVTGFIRRPGKGWLCVCRCRCGNTTYTVPWMVVNRTRSCAPCAQQRIKAARYRWNGGKFQEVG